MIVHLLRHGQSTWNLEKRLQGQTMHVPLTELGRDQARDAAGKLRERPIAAVWSSDQLRALETARLVAGVHQLPVTEAPWLREQCLGELEGRRYSELRPEDTPEGMHISEVRWGGGESIADVADRLRPGMDELRRRYGAEDEVVLVSHGDTLSVLLAILEGRGHRDVAWPSWANGHVETRTLD